VRCSPNSMEPIWRRLELQLDFFIATIVSGASPAGPSTLKLLEFRSSPASPNAVNRCSSGSCQRSWTRSGALKPGLLVAYALLRADSVAPIAMATSFPRDLLAQHQCLEGSGPPISVAHFARVEC